MYKEKTEIFFYEPGILLKCISCLYVGEEETFKDNLSTLHKRKPMGLEIRYKCPKCEEYWIIIL
jgi:hypothetical protein